METGWARASAAASYHPQESLAALGTVSPVGLSKVVGVPLCVAESARAASRSVLACAAEGGSVSSSTMRDAARCVSGLLHTIRSCAATLAPDVYTSLQLSALFDAALVWDKLGETARAAEVMETGIVAWASRGPRLLEAPRCKRHRGGTAPTLEPGTARVVECLIQGLATMPVRGETHSDGLGRRAGLEPIVQWDLVLRHAAVHVRLSWRLALTWLRAGLWHGALAVLRALDAHLDPGSCGAPDVHVLQAATKYLMAAALLRGVSGFGHDAHPESGLGDDALVHEAIGRLGESAPHFPPAQKLLGVVLLHRGDTREAADMLRRASSSGDPVALVLYGHALCADGRFMDAVAAFRRSLRVAFGSNLASVFNVAALYGHIGALAGQRQMLAYLMEACQPAVTAMQPGSERQQEGAAGSLAAGAIAPVAAGGMHLRLPLLEFVVRGASVLCAAPRGVCSPGGGVIAEGHFAAGKLACDEAQWEEADRHLQVVVSTLEASLVTVGAPPLKGQERVSSGVDLVEALGYRAHVLLQLGRHSEALDICERLVAVCPNDLSVRMMQADALVCLERTHEARVAIDAVLAALEPAGEPVRSRGARDNGSDDPVAVAVKTVCSGFHMRGVARCKDRTAVEAGPTVRPGVARAMLAQAANNKALLLVCEGDRERAQGLLRSAIALDPSLVQPAFNLAVLLWDAGKRLEACMVWFDSGRGGRSGLPRQCVGSGASQGVVAGAAPRVPSSGLRGRSHACAAGKPTSHVMAEHR